MKASALLLAVATVGLLVLASVGNPTLPPHSPCELVATPMSSTQINLTWTAGIRDIEGVTLGGGTLAWAVEPRAATYDVARGVVNELPVGAGPAEICLAPRTSATATIDPFPPAAGQALWYLVRARNACGQSLNGAYGQGIYGGQFQPRVTQVCP